MQERPVWRAALQDVLSVQPLSHIEREIHAMSSRALQTACARVAHVERSISREEYTPVISADVIANGYSRIVLLASGVRYIAFEATGGMQLKLVRDSKTLDSVVAPNEPPRSFDYRILPVSSTETLLLHALHCDS